MALPTGTLLGPYEIRSTLGAGGMGEVYRAHDKRLRRDVALKVLPAALLRDPARHQRFTQEAHAASALNHPNIVSVFDVNLEYDPPYLVTEFVEGGSLRELMRKGPMPTAKLLDIAAQIADGLATAHRAGIVHRDLKPENILITTDGRAKIADFGLARQLRESEGDENQETASISLTEMGTVVGTAKYMSPEQARGQPLDTRSDGFSFGLILYEMASGKHPFDQGSKMDTISAILRDEPPPIEAKVPPPLCWLIERCLAKDPGLRYESTRDLFHELRYQRAHLSEIQSSATGTAARRTARTMPSRWRAPAFFAAGATLLTLTLALLMTEPRLVPLRANQFRPLLTGPENEDAAAWSPDGVSLAYAATVDGIQQILTTKADAVAPLQVTHCTSRCGDPAWSPDGRSLLYTWNSAIWTVGAAGGEPHKLVSDADRFALSHDGKTLAFGRRQFTPILSFSVWISSPPGNAPVRYTPAPFEGARYGGSALALSPDGKRLLWFARTVDQDRGSEFWVLPLPPGSGTPHKVLEKLGAPYTVRGLSWMPDSRRIVVACIMAPDPYRSHLYLADVDSGDYRPLVVGSGSEALPNVSWNGKRIAYTAMDYNSDIVELPLDGSPVRDLIVTSRMEHSPAWFPKSRELAYVTDRTGRDEIWVRDMDRGRERPLVNAASFSEGETQFMLLPVLSPDGERVAFVRWGTDGGKIWIASVSGGAPLRLAVSGAPVVQHAPTWSPDGNWIAFRSQHPKSALMKARVGSSEPPVMIVDTTGFRYDMVPEWSPTGEWIAYYEGMDGEALLLISPDGQKKRVLRKPALQGVAWSRDGKKLYGLETRPQRLIELDVATGKERTISVTDPRVYIRSPWLPGLRLSLSPDNRTLAMTSLHSSGDVWMLEDFDRHVGLLARFGLGAR